MKSLFIFFALICLSFTAFCGVKIDSLLARKIKMMFIEDQRWRIELTNLQNGKGLKYDEATIEKNMGKTDGQNMMEAKRIVAKYGFPGYSLVGEECSDKFWAIVQHCDDDVPFQQKVLLLMAKEVKKHNAAGDNYALLQDRVLANQGKKQLYGTQVRVDPKTHRAKPLPIQDSLHVDARRKAVGLQPLKDYLKSFEKH